QPLTENDTKRLLLPLLTKKQIKELSHGKEADFSFQKEQGRFRTNVYLQKGKISGSFRLVKSAIPSLDELGIPPSIKQALSFTSGLFLLTGPTGSGKSTSMAGMVEYMNNNLKYHIITLEDPIEYVFEDKGCIISQREVGIDTISYNEGMRAALRQDPDVIILGELRDAETVSQALKAAETGHFVISTLHSPNAIQTIGRIVDLFPPADRMSVCATISETLCGILSHKLILSSDMEKRVLIPELLFVTPTIASLIRAGQHHEIYDYMKEGSTEGMVTFNQSFLTRIKEGIITEETALAYAEEPNELSLMLKNMAPSGGSNEAQFIGHKLY
ncbi:MAG: PilT/PilU family type 4a pilus ATPase, partial [bacterium]|nr:PilT/PilU family type 4a pilus ATPase [bacterium]